MLSVPRKLVVDENAKPIAVVIDYADWVRIENALASLEDGAAGSGDLSPFFGTLVLREDPLAYQARTRDEWN